MYEIVLRSPIKLSFKDYLLLNYWYTYRKFSFRLATFLGIVYMPSLIFAVTFIIDDVDSLIPMYLIWGFVFIFFLAIVPVGIYVQSRRSFSTDKLIQLEYKYSFGPEGLTSRSDSSNAKVTWDQVFQIYDIEQYLYIFVARAKGIIIPKAKIVDQYGDVIRIISENAAEKLKKGKGLRNLALRLIVVSIIWVIVLGISVYIFETIVL